MLLPEVILYNSVKSLLDLATTDYNSATDKSRTILSDIFNVDDNGDAIVIDTYNYFEQAKSLLLRTSSSSRKLQTFIGYNMQRASLPTVHILMPNESKGNIDSLGDSEGQPATEVDTVNSQLIITKQKSSFGTYHLMITSDNSSEVLIVYYFLKAIFILYDSHFELSGFHNFSFSGADLQFQQDLAPNNVFHRNLSVTFSYNSKMKMRTAYQNATGFNVGTGNC